MADDDARLAVVIEARLDKLQTSLNNVNRSIHGSMAKAEKDIEGVHSKWDKMFLGEGPGKALDKVFSRARLGVIEEGGAKIGIFGSAIEALGPAGITAAAGLGAVALALEQAHKAAEYADQLEDTASRLHVTTDALQEYRYAVRAAGGEFAGADEALEAFSENLGKAQEGLKKGQRAFLALGFSKEEISGFKDADEALRAVVARVAELKSNPQQDAIIEQLGLKGIKPLIQDVIRTGDEIDVLLSKARDAGAVLDSDLVHRGAEANKQFELLSHVVDVQLKSAFIDLAPVLVELLTFAAKFAREIAHVADLLRDIEHKSNTGLQDQRAALISQSSHFGLTPNPVQQGLLQRNAQRVAEIDAELAKRAAADRATDPGGGSRSLVIPAGKTPHAKKAPTDENAQALDTAVKAELEAYASLLQVLLDQANAYEDQTPKIQELADIKTRQIDAELKAQNDRTDRALKEKHITAATAEQVKAKDAQAAEEKRRAVVLETQRRIAEAAQARDEANFAYQQDIRGSYSEIAGIAADQARTAAERRTIELRNFDLNTKLDRDILVAKNDYLVSIGKLSRSGADESLATFDDLTTARRGGVVQNTKGFLDQGRDQARGQADSIASGIVTGDDLASRKQEQLDQIKRLENEHTLTTEQANRARADVESRYLDERTQAYGEMFSQLSQLSSSGNSKLAAIGKAAAIAEAIRNTAVGVTKALSLPVPLNFIDAGIIAALGAVQIAKIAGAGFEKGGYTGNGGRSQIMGPVHGQEYVFDADTTARNRPLLDMLQSGGTFRMPSIPTRQPVTMRHDVRIAVDVTGANGDEAVRRIAGESASRAAHAAYTQAMADVPGRMIAYQQLEQP